MPFEVDIPVAIELIKSPATNLNGLAEKMHLALVILVKMMFYPIITAIPFALMQFTIENKQESHPN